MIRAGKKVYNPLTDTYSTGYWYWMKDNQRYWHTVWNKLRYRNDIKKNVKGEKNNVRNT